MNALTLIWRDPVLRLAAGLMVMTGTSWASFGPFIALLAVETFQLGDRGYALVWAISTLVGVMASLAIGIRADQSASRRKILLATSALVGLSMTLMTLAPAQVMFIIVHALFYLVSSTIFAQVFTLARLAATNKSPQDRQSIIFAIRAAVSLPFVVILPLWSVALGKGISLPAIYPAALVFALPMPGAVLRF
jgi:SET family sugar efflux transporter-like MFS transporter